MMEWMEGVAPSWLPAWLLSMVILAGGALLALAAH